MDNLYRRLDLEKEANRSGIPSQAEMRLIGQIQSHGSHGHDDKPCPGDFAQIYNRFQ